MTDHSNSNGIIPASGIARVILNDEEKSEESLGAIIPVLSNRDILIEKGGYIFNSSISDNCLCLSIRPCFIDGQRMYHYEIELPVKGECVLFGFITSNGLALLFKPESNTYERGFLPGMAAIFRDNYVRLARFLVEHGFSRHFALEFTTISTLEEVRLFAEIPATVNELALRTAAFDAK